MSIANLDSLYTAHERALLAKWFAGRGNSLTIRQSMLLDRLGFETDPGDLYTRLDAWVGAFATRDVQSRLPNWGLVNSDGTLVLARKVDRTRRSKTVTGLSRFLLEINWADSGPGYSWPAVYSVTWLPGFDRHVVTYSADSPDALGYCDFALGHFAHHADAHENRAQVRAIIVGDWRRQFELYDQAPWEHLLQAGDVSDAEAMQWRAEAWAGHDEYSLPDEEDDGQA